MFGKDSILLHCATTRCSGGWDGGWSSPVRSGNKMKWRNNISFSSARHFLQSQLMRLVAGSNSVLKMSNENVGSYFNRNY